MLNTKLDATSVHDDFFVLPDDVNTIAPSLRWETGASTLVANEANHLGIIRLTSDPAGASVYTVDPIVVQDFLSEDFIIDATWIIKIPPISSFLGSDVLQIGLGGPGGFPVMGPGGNSFLGAMFLPGNGIFNLSFGGINGGGSFGSIVNLFTPPISSQWCRIDVKYVPPTASLFIPPVYTASVNGYATSFVGGGAPLTRAIVFAQNTGGGPTFDVDIDYFGITYTRMTR